MARPKVLLFDVNETLLTLTPLKENVSKVPDGRSELVPLWFTTTLQYSLVATVGDWRSVAKGTHLGGKTGAVNGPTVAGWACCRFPEAAAAESSMLTVDDYARIRRGYRDGMGIREMARTFSHSRRKIREIPRSSGEPTPYRPRGSQPAPKLGPFHEVIRQILKEDEMSLEINHRTGVDRLCGL